MHSSFKQYICIKDKKVFIEEPPKISFYIHITKHIIKFYFMIPTCCVNSFHATCKDIWKNIEIKPVAELPLIEQCSTAQLTYLNSPALSLAVDRRNNDLLNANMTVAELLEDNESLGIFYNLIPTSLKETSYFQLNEYSVSLEKYKNGDGLKRFKTLKDYIVLYLQYVFDFADDVLSAFIGSPPKTHVWQENIPSASTLRKGRNDLCKMQGVLFASALNKKRELELLHMLGNTYKFIADDNELLIVYKSIPINIKKQVLAQVPINKTTVEENSNFISLPSLEIIEQFNMIQHNRVLEKKAPECLFQGAVKIGTVKHKEQSQTIYYSMDKELKRLGRVLLGSMGSGKSYYLKNLAKDIVADNRGLVIIDYIDRCQLADSIKAVVPREKVVEINVDNINELQSFNFNELKYSDTDSIEHKINIAMQKAEQMQLLLDSINDDNSKLTPRMLRYFYAASTLAYYSNQYCGLKNIAQLLKNPYQRLMVIGQLCEQERILLGEEIEDLEDLTKEEKSGKLGNCDSKIDGILDRIAWLKTNLYTKLAFNQSAENNYDFIDLLAKNKVILIKIPEKSFKSRMIRNVIATFFLNKIWVSKQMNSETHTELFFDEIHQCYNCQLLMKNILVECRKFQLTPTLALHYFNQLTPDCKSSLLESGASFLLLQGCNVKEFQELAIYFEKDGYTPTDLAELERYHALCLIKNEKTGYSSFVVKLPS